MSNLGDLGIALNIDFSDLDQQLRQIEKRKIAPLKLDVGINPQSLNTQLKTLKLNAIAVQLVPDIQGLQRQLQGLKVGATVAVEVDTKSLQGKLKSLKVDPINLEVKLQTSQIQQQIKQQVQGIGVEINGRVKLDAADIARQVQKLSGSALSVNLKLNTDNIDQQVQTLRNRAAATAEMPVQLRYVQPKTKTETLTQKVQIDTNGLEEKIAKSVEKGSKKSQKKGLIETAIDLPKNIIGNTAKSFSDGINFTYAQKFAEGSLRNLEKDLGQGLDQIGETFSANFSKIGKFAGNRLAQRLGFDEGLADLNKLVAQSTQETREFFNEIIDEKALSRKFSVVEVQVGKLIDDLVALKNVEIQLKNLQGVGGAIADIGSVPNEGLTRRRQRIFADEAKAIKERNKNNTAPAEEVNPNAEYITLVSGGFAGKGGKSSQGVADKVQMLLGDRHHVRAIANTATDSFASIQELGTTKWLANAGAKIAEQNLSKGANPDAVRMAEEAYKLYQQTQKPVRLVGYSSGGLVAHDAAEILKQLKVPVKAVGLGTPHWGQRSSLSANDYQTFLREEDGVNTVARAIEPLAGKLDRKKTNYSPGFGHDLEDYLGQTASQVPLLKHLEGDQYQERSKRLQQPGVYALPDLGKRVEGQLDNTQFLLSSPFKKPMVQNGLLQQNLQGIQSLRRELSKTLQGLDKDVQAELTDVLRVLLDAQKATQVALGQRKAPKQKQQPVALAGGLEKLEAELNELMGTVEAVLSNPEQAGLFVKKGVNKGILKQVEAKRGQIQSLLQTASKEDSEKLEAYLGGLSEIEQVVQEVFGSQAAPPPIPEAPKQKPVSSQERLDRSYRNLVQQTAEATGVGALPESQIPALVPDASLPKGANGGYFSDQNRVGIPPEKLENFQRLIGKQISELTEEELDQAAKQFSTLAHEVFHGAQYGFSGKSRLDLAAAGGVAIPAPKVSDHERATFEQARGTSLEKLEAGSTTSVVRSKGYASQTPAQQQATRQTSQDLERGAYAYGAKAMTSFLDQAQAASGKVGVTVADVIEKAIANVTQDVQQQFAQLTDAQKSLQQYSDEVLIEIAKVSGKVQGGKGTRGTLISQLTELNTQDLEKAIATVKPFVEQGAQGQTIKRPEQPTGDEQKVLGQIKEAEKRINDTLREVQSAEGKRREQIIEAAFNEINQTIALIDDLKGNVISNETRTSVGRTKGRMEGLRLEFERAETKAPVSVAELAPKTAPKPQTQLTPEPVKPKPKAAQAEAATRETASVQIQKADTSALEKQLQEIQERFGSEIVIHSRFGPIDTSTLEAHLKKIHEQLGNGIAVRAHTTAIDTSTLEAHLKKIQEQLGAGISIKSHTTEIDTSTLEAHLKKIHEQLGAGIAVPVNLSLSNVAALETELTTLQAQFEKGLQISVSLVNLLDVAGIQKALADAIAAGFQEGQSRAAITPRNEIPEAVSQPTTGAQTVQADPQPPPVEVAPVEEVKPQVEKVEEEVKQLQDEVEDALGALLGGLEEADVPAEDVKPQAEKVEQEVKQLQSEVDDALGALIGGLEAPKIEVEAPPVAKTVEKALNKYTVEILKEMNRISGLGTKGKKEDLIKNLLGLDPADLEATIDAIEPLIEQGPKGGQKLKKVEKSGPEVKSLSNLAAAEERLNVRLQQLQKASGQERQKVIDAALKEIGETLAYLDGLEKKPLTAEGRLSAAKTRRRVEAAKEQFTPSAPEPNLDNIGLARVDVGAVGAQIGSQLQRIGTGSKGAIAEVQKTFAQSIKQQQLDIEKVYTALVKEAAKLSDIGLKPGEIPKLVIDDGKLKQLGARALYEAKENQIVVTQALADLLGSSLQNIEQNQHLAADILHEARHAFQTDFGKTSLNQIAAGQATFGVQTVSTETASSESLDGAIKSVSAANQQAGGQLSGRQKKTISRAEVDAYEFERKATPKAVQALSGLNLNLGKPQAEMSRLSQVLKLGEEGVAFLQNKFKGLENQLNELVPAFGGLGTGLKNAVVGFVAFQVIGTLTQQLAAFGAESLDAALKFNNLKTALDFASGSSTAGTKNLEFVRKTVDDLKIPLGAAQQGFKQLAASTRGTGSQGQTTHDLFTGVSQASTVLGLTSEQTDGAFTAISQMASKGCHGKGALIRLFDGTAKLVEEIEAGDLLMGPDGLPRVVIVLARGTDELYRITPESGNSFVVNLHHKMRLIRNGITSTVILKDYLQLSYKEKEDFKWIRHNHQSETFKVHYQEEGEFFGFYISGNHLYLDAQGFEHHNTVSAEELRQQLAERIPGAFGIAARAIGVTESELNKMLETGSVVADEFLPKFARQLQVEFGGAAVNASNNAQSAIFAFQNAVLKLQESIGQALQPGQMTILNAFTAGIELLTNNMKMLGDIALSTALITGLKFIAPFIKLEPVLTAANAAIGFLQQGLGLLSALISGKLAGSGLLLAQIFTGLRTLLKTFLAEFILPAAAFESVKTLFSLFQTTELSSQFREFGDQAVASLQRIEEAGRKAKGEMPQPKGPSGLKSEGFDLTLGFGDAVGLQNGFRTDDLITAFRQIPGVNQIKQGVEGATGGAISPFTTVAEKKFNDTKVELGNFTSAVYATTEKAFDNRSLRGQISQVDDIDRQLKDLQLQRKRLSDSPQVDKNALNDLSKQEQELLQKRQQASAPLLETQGAISNQLKNARAALEAVDQQGLPVEQAKELKDQLGGTIANLEAAEKNLNKLQASGKNAVDPVRKLLVAFDDIAKKLAEVAIKADKAFQNRSQQINAKQLQGFSTNQDASRTAARERSEAERDRLKTQITESEKLIGDTRKEVDDPAINQMLSGITTSDGKGISLESNVSEIENAKSRLSDKDSAKKDILDRLKQFKEAEKQLNEQKTQLGQSELSVKQAQEAEALGKFDRNAQTQSALLQRGANDRQLAILKGQLGKFGPKLSARDAVALEGESAIKSAQSDLTSTQQAQTNNEQQLAKLRRQKDLISAEEFAKRERELINQNSELKVKAAQQELAVKEAVQKKALSLIEFEAQQRENAIKRAESNAAAVRSGRQANVVRLRSQKRITEDDAAVMNADIQSQSAQDEAKFAGQRENSAAIQLQQLQQAYKSGKLSSEEFHKRESDLTNQLGDLKARKAQAQLQVEEAAAAKIEAVNRKLINQFELAIKKAETAIALAQTNRGIAAKQDLIAVGGGGELADQATSNAQTVSEIGASQQRMALKQQELAFNRQMIAEGRRDAKEGAEKEIALLQELSQLKADQVDKELQMVKQLRQARINYQNRIYTLQQKEIDLQGKLLDSQKQLVDAYNGLQKARNDAATSGLQSQSNSLDKNLDLARGLKEGKFKGEQEKIAQEQLSKQGFSNDPEQAEREILERKAKIEDAIAEKKAEALNAELEMQKRSLEIEYIKFKLAQQKAELEARKEVRDAKLKVEDSNLAVQQAEKAVGRAQTPEEEKAAEAALKKAKLDQSLAKDELKSSAQNYLATDAMGQMGEKSFAYQREALGITAESKRAEFLAGDDARKLDQRMALAGVGSTNVQNDGVAAALYSGPKGGPDMSGFGPSAQSQAMLKKIMSGSGIEIPGINARTSEVGSRVSQVDSDSSQSRAEMKQMYEQIKALAAKPSEIHVTSQDPVSDAAKVYRDVQRNRIATSSSF